MIKPELQKLALLRNERLEIAGENTKWKRQVRFVEFYKSQKTVSISGYRGIDSPRRWFWNKQCFVILEVIEEESTLHVSIIRVGTTELANLLVDLLLLNKKYDLLNLPKCVYLLQLGFHKPTFAKHEKYITNNAI